MDNDTDIVPAWMSIVNWNVECRYLSGKSEKEAKGLYEDSVEKVIPWIRVHW